MEALVLKKPYWKALTPSTKKEIFLEKKAVEAGRKRLEDLWE